jgi:hypothetical protein
MPKVTINTIEGPKEAEVYFNEGGLAVTFEPVSTPGVYVVTHLQTGHRILTGFFNPENAKGFLLEILPITDWNSIPNPHALPFNDEQKRTIRVAHAKWDALDPLEEDQL